MQDADRRLLADLLHTVWEDTDTTKAVHRQEMDAMSFCAVSNGIFIGYAGVVNWDIRIGNTRFKMGGLSCVCTHPSHRKNGIASDLVKKATEWIMLNERIDIGLFTCSQEHTPFYEKNSLWQRSPFLILKESDREGAYRSDLMGLNVFKLLVSPKSRLYAGYFERGTITLNFPEGEFI